MELDLSIKRGLKINGDYSVYFAPYCETYELLQYQNGFASFGLGNEDVLISKEDLKTYFEPIEFSDDLRVSSTGKGLVNYHTLYGHYGLNIILLVDRMDKEENHQIYNIYYKKELRNVGAICEYLNKMLIFPTNLSDKASVGLVLENKQGYFIKNVEITPKSINLEKHYNDDFRPIYDVIKNSLEEDKKGIVLLHGDAGTGKTNLIKHLTGVVKDKNFLYIPANMIGFLTDPSFVGTMLDNKNSVLILEDCEVYIQSRKQSGGSNSNFVSTLLNISDGILSDVMDIQIICTFNNDIQDIDEAILREGRLIAEYKFGELSQDKSNIILKETGYKLDSGKKRTLANLYNANRKTNRVNKQNKIGFQ